MTLESSWFFPAKWRWAVTVVNPGVKKMLAIWGWKLDHHRTVCWYITSGLSVLIMCFVMFISVLHALYFSGLWQKVENFVETLSDIITIFSFLLALIVNYWWHSLLVSCSAFPFILKDKAGIINSAIRHFFLGWLLSQNLDTEKCFMTWKGSLQRDIKSGSRTCQILDIFVFHLCVT